MDNRVIMYFAFALMTIASLAAYAADERAAAQKPNVIFILSDDVGLGDVHCTGGHYSTPNIDLLAKGGMRFEYCYATPLCGPSRALFLTGRYPFRTGLISNQSAAALNEHKEIMIPTVMKEAGYVTACVGKWGQMPYGPREWGFEHTLSFHGSGRYWSTQNIKYEQDGEWKDLREGEYLPDLMHTFVAQFLEKNKDKPFFLYYPMSHMHGPILKTPESKKSEKPDQLYTDNIEYMDKLVGQLMTELDRLKLRENTLVIFTGDNGTARFGKEISTVDGKAISGQKGTMLEGGSREPLIVNWPGVTPAGKVSKDLIDFSDFFATFADLGGAELPHGVNIDGRSFAAQIKGEKGTPREWIYVELSGNSYVRDARYKLTNAGKLFDLKNAPFEEIPVPDDTTDADALAAKKKLQTVLDNHPAGDASGIVKKPGKARKAARRRNASAVIDAEKSQETLTTEAVTTRDVA